MSQTHKSTNVVLIAAFTLISALSAIAATAQPIVGELSESMCGAKHMLPGKTAAECTHECVKANSKYALVVEKKVYVLSGPKEEFSRLAGKRVRVVGEQKGDTIAVSSITAAGK